MFVIACGAHTSVGIDATESISSFRAGLTRLQRSPEYRDKNWEPVKVAMIEYIPETISYTTRFVDIGHPAFEQILNPFEGEKTKPKRLPIFLGLPEKRPGCPQDLEPALTKMMTAVLEARGLIPDITCIASGHASGGEALKRANRVFESGDADYMVIGGIDSYIDGTTLLHFEENGRLFTSYRSNGFVPGEAASFCLLASSNAVKRDAPETKAEVVGVGCSKEERVHGSKLPCLGNGLSEAVAGALEGVEPDTVVDQVFCCLNGENYGSKEWGYTSLRLANRLPESQELICGTTAWGDVGAATVPLLMCHAVHSGEWGYASGPHALIFASSLGKERAAALLKLSINEERRIKWEK